MIDDRRWDFDHYGRWREQEPTPSQLSVVWNYAIPNMISALYNLARATEERKQRKIEIERIFCEMTGRTHYNQFKYRDDESPLSEEQRMEIVWLRTERAHLQHEISNQRRVLCENKSDWENWAEGTIRIIEAEARPRRLLTRRYRRTTNEMPKM